MHSMDGCIIISPLYSKYEVVALNVYPRITQPTWDCSGSTILVLVLVVSYLASHVACRRETQTSTERSAYHHGASLFWFKYLQEPVLRYIFPRCRVSVVDLFSASQLTMLKYPARYLRLISVLQILYAAICLTTPLPILRDTGSISFIQPPANITGIIATNLPDVENSTARIASPYRPGYRYDVPNTNTWLRFRFNGARKIEHNALVLSLISAIDETRTDISILGGATPVNERNGPFNQHVKGCMFTISSTLNPNKVRRMTYSMRLDTLVGLYNVLVKAKREEAAEFIIYYEGLGLVGVGTIDKQKRFPSTQ